MKPRFGMTPQERQHEREVKAFFLQCEAEGRITSEELADLHIGADWQGLPYRPDEEDEN